MPQLFRLTLCEVRGGMQHAESVSAAVSDVLPDRSPLGKDLFSTYPGPRKPQILTDFAALLVRLALLEDRDGEDPVFEGSRKSARIAGLRDRSLCRCV